VREEHNGGMFLRCTQRIKDGKLHRYWSIVENRRNAQRSDGRQLKVPSVKE